MIKYIVYRRILMATSDKVSKDHELLIRLDERLLLLYNEIAEIKQIMSNQQSQSVENKKRLDKLELTVFGANNVDGLYQKTEKHDKLLTKAMAYFTIIAIVIEFCFKFYFHGM
ncbi:MAG: hypothetical protein IKT40_01070 [Bacilli bacterium]|nr:hypothetical protein [Bacilli bacterium]